MITTLRNHITQLSANKKKVLQNTFWLSAAEIGSRVARGALAIFAAKIIGVSGLGIFSYAIALGGFITFFEDAGVATYVTRSFARNDTDRHIILGTAFVLKLFLGIIAFSLFVGIGPFVSSIPEARVLIPVAAVLLFFDALRGFFFSITRAEQRMHIDSQVQILTNGLIVVLGIGLLYLSPTPLSLVTGYALGSALGTGVMFYVIKDYFPNIRKTFSKKLFWDIFLAAWPFTIMAISNVLIFNTDTLFLGYYGTTQDIGWYSAASRLVQMFYIIPALFSASTFSLLVQKSADPAGIRAAIKKSLWLMIAIATPLVVIMTIGASPIINILFGPAFAPAALMLAILALSYIPIYIRSILNNIILVLDKQRHFVYANIAGVVVNIGLDFLLIPHYQGIGASIASVAGLTTITLVTMVLIKKHNLLNA